MYRPRKIPSPTTIIFLTTMFRYIESTKPAAIAKRKPRNKMI